MTTTHLVETVEKYLTTQRSLERAWLTGRPAPRELLVALEHELQHELARAKSHHEQRTFARILVAVDNNPRAAWVIHAAAALAGVMETSTLRVVHVIDPAYAVNNEYGIADTNVLSQMRDTADLFLATLTADLPQAADVIVREGSPGEQIATEARNWHADLIVLATPSHGQFVELLTGSAAEYLMRHTTCPILTVSHDTAPLPQDPIPTGDPSI
jgi:nucleotide-binding universal stress UspA family protein